MILVIQYGEVGDFHNAPTGVKGNQVKIPGPATELYHPRVIRAVTLASTEMPMVVLGRVFFSLLSGTTPSTACLTKGVTSL